MSNALVAPAQLVKVWISLDTADLQLEDGTAVRVAAPLPGLLYQHEGEWGVATIEDGSLRDWSPNGAPTRAEQPWLIPYSACTKCEWMRVFGSASDWRQHLATSCPACGAPVESDAATREQFTAFAARIRASVTGVTDLDLP